jgi:hypothetical protein
MGSILSILKVNRLLISSAVWKLGNVNGDDEEDDK